ncbi:MAG: T9SS type A sorting domain-containing protein [candidate division Zixibacteria bacterium]|nr:T9SS type A sorting domain-containing protein [Candidatus Tariuqbacter arcticus]
MKTPSITLILIATTILLVFNTAIAQEHRTGLLTPDVMPDWVQKSPPIKLIAAYDDSCDHSDHFPPVGNQGGQGSCVGWATAYYYKTYQEWEEHGWDVTSTSHQFSPAFMYNQINGGVDQGAYFEDAFKLLCDLGGATQADMPYTSSNYTNLPEEEDYLNGINYRCQEFYYIDVYAGLDDLRNHLLNGHAAVVGIDVYSNFDYISSYNNTYCVCEIYGSMRGGHAVTFCGFDDDRVTSDGVGAFKLANSWGTGWGDSGYFWMSYEAVQDDTLSHGCAFYTIDFIDYEPSLITRFQVAHDDRYAIQYLFDIFNPSGGFWERAFFDWYMEPMAAVANPAANIVLDLTDGAGTLSPAEINTIAMQCHDLNIGNGLTGSIEYFSAEEFIWPANAVSPDPPVAIPDDGSYVCADLELIMPGEVTLTLTPHSPPIVIPSGGGSFQFDLEISNTTIFAYIIDVWTDVTLPDGTLYPIAIRENVDLSAGGIIVREDMTQFVPPGAPTGTYSYNAYVQDHITLELLSEDSFPFEKLPGADSPNHNFGWTLDGFDGEEAPIYPHPSSFVLHPCNPNPFNPTTAISYQLRAASFVKLVVYDVMGREVARLADGWKSAGSYEVAFNASELTSGVYFARLTTASGFQQTQKLLLVK